MSTPSDIRSQWATDVWADASVSALTSRIYDYDITQQSGFEKAKLRHGQEVNFFTYLCTRGWRNRGLGSAGPMSTNRFIYYLHRVEVNYYLEYDTSGANFNNVIDRLVTVETAVQANLGTSWSTLVDFYRLDEVREPTIVTIDDEPCWRGVNVYIAEDKTSF